MGMERRLIGVLCKNLNDSVTDSEEDKVAIVRFARGKTYNITPISSTDTIHLPEIEESTVGEQDMRYDEDAARRTRIINNVK